MLGCLALSPTLDAGCVKDKSSGAIVRISSLPSVAGHSFYLLVHVWSLRATYLVYIAFGSYLPVLFYSLRPITLNGGYQMPGWSDIFGLQEDSPEDAEVH